MTAASPVFLAGPTASGKSAVALALAERLGGEIISVDSMQVYRGLDIGTAKPDAPDRRRVRHHLIDVADLHEPFDAAQFVALAAQAVDDIRQRGKVPVFCGGTGLYFKAYLHGLGEAPPGDPKLRAELEARPLDNLLRELETLDPASFARIDRQNPRRVVRALEIIRLTGRALDTVRADWRSQSKEKVFVLRRDQGDLTQRIHQRVDAMFAAGLIEETRRLLQQGLAANATAMQAIGYRQVVAHLKGELPLEETIELVKRRTRQFARRQMTWFRHQLPCEWMDLASEARADEIAARLAALLEAPKDGTKSASRHETGC